MPESSILKRPANAIVTATCLIALLHFGREVLQPITLAFVLSLAIAPLITALASCGLSRAKSTFAALGIVVAVLAGGGTVLAGQLLSLTTELPQYRDQIRAKMKQLEVLAEQPLARLPTELLAPGPVPFEERDAATIAGLKPNPAQPIPVEIHERMSTQDSVTRAISVVSGPLGEAGLVLVLLIFILLDYESLRDRVIRLTGQRDVSRTMKGLEDAAHGVSRFFFSQFVVNLVFGTVVCLVLWLLGIPHAALWGAMCALLRFVPYIGALIAGGGIALFAAAVDPGWTLAIVALLLFGALELLVANVVEPRVYGHSSGMSPLAIIVSALFWSALWGPVGLLLATPLTLCLVIAGRYVKGLEPVSILFAETPNASGAHRFYHRALSGDAAAILDDARTFLRKSSMARYCDQILLPGMILAGNDLRGGTIEKEQEERLRSTIVMVADTLAAGGKPPRSRRRSVSILNEGIGAHLRHAREERLGRWQGSLDVPEHSVILCASMENIRDEFLNELLVLALREAGLDARSIVLTKEQREAQPEAEHLLSTVFVIAPIDCSVEDWCGAVSELRGHLHDIPVVTMRPQEEMRATPAAVAQQTDLVLHTFEEALAFVSPVRQR
jgi:predicted PurR-regulated permease PerM